MEIFIYTQVMIKIIMKNKQEKPKKQKLQTKETLEQEIKEAIEEEKEHVEEAQKIAEEQEKIDETKEAQPYKKVETPQEKYSEGKKLQTDYIDNQEFYIKNEKDFDTIKNTMQELKAQDPSMSRVDDSDLWEIEPETKKLKIRKMPRTILDMLKQKQIVIDYYKVL